MLLVIDAGNTNIVFALYQGEQSLGVWRISTDRRRTADEYAVWFAQLLAMDRRKLADIDAAVMASVVPDVTFNLRMLCRQHLELDPVVVGDPLVGLDLAIETERPEEVGADRLVNAIAGFERHGGPLIIVDFGTATTFDVVSDSGSFRGGVIAPSAHHSLEALHRAAAKLPQVDIVRPDRVIGTATVPAMRSGVYWGYVGLIEGLIARIQTEYGHKMRVIATGGLADVFRADCPSIEIVDPDLTLRGLVLIHRRNRTRA